VVFAYYRRLSAAQKRIYRKSDEVASLRLPRATTLHPLVATLSEALQAEDRVRTRRTCQQLADRITSEFQVPTVQVEVLAVRPASDCSELHGLYTPPSGCPACIQLWMRTAHHKRVVAFRTFLRTLLHELCHHLDYELLALADSFHTQGFYQRLSSLFHQLMPSARTDGEGRDSA
jgi:hypothetical protein